MVTEYWEKGLMDSIKEKRKALVNLLLQKKGYIESLKNINKAIKELEDEIERLATSEVLKR